MMSSIAVTKMKTRAGWKRGMSPTVGQVRGEAEAELALTSHCERSEAIQPRSMDYFVATLLAMTGDSSQSRMFTNVRAREHVSRR